MNTLQKASCIGALAAGMLAAEPVHAQPTNVYGIRQETVVKQEVAKKEELGVNGRDPFLIWAYGSLGFMVATLGMGIAYALRDKGDQRYR